MTQTPTPAPAAQGPTWLLWLAAVFALTSAACTFDLLPKASWPTESISDVAMSLFLICFGASSMSQQRNRPASLMLGIAMASCGVLLLVGWLLGW